MKVLKFVSVFCLTILFISCSSDDSSPIDTNAQADDLTAIWNLNEITQEGTITTDVQGVPVQSTFTSFGKDINAQVEFKQNPNNFTSSGSYTSVVTISLLGQSNTQEVSVPIDDFLNQGTWSLNNGVMTISQNGETVEANVIELTNTSLKLELEDERVIVEQGFTNTTKTKVNMTLTK